MHGKSNASSIVTVKGARTLTCLAKADYVSAVRAHAWSSHPGRGDKRNRTGCVLCQGILRELSEHPPLALIFDPDQTMAGRPCSLEPVKWLIQFPLS